MRDVDKLWKLLMDLDAQEPRECATNFDHAESISRFHKVREALETEFQTQLPYESGPAIQDAAFHSWVALPSPKGPASVRFSNFDALVAVWGDDETVPTDLLERAVGVLERHGYTFVPFSLLKQPHEEPDIPDWWARFFEYV